ncbi:hypothetical protein [Glycomyces sp. NPDC048151]|uniref:hypothetical protein n=1 Tax=Glycomyces sp. NPDC048151 TaxID=3364002 RepID=UPI003717E9AF
MPRRQPARVRAEQPRYRRWRYRKYPIPRVNGASGALQAAVVRLENADTRFEIGGIARALRGWRGRVRCTLRPQCRDYYCPCCSDPDRETLEDAMRRLPKRQAQELRRLVEPLDEEFIRRTIPVPQWKAGPWWWFRE